MQQVAAATEQQSASAEEIAAASAALASASQRLLEIVSVFRLDAPGEESVAAAERRAQRAKTREPSAAASTGLVRLAASPDRA
jgi:hypothetical protein